MLLIVLICYVDSFSFFPFLWGTHELWPTDADILPATQLEHEESPKAAYLPTAQPEQAPPTNICPAEHTQAVAPIGDERPVGQFVQAVDPADAEYLPDGQGV